MALDMSGLFVNPALIRDKRIDAIAQQQQSLGQLGGSMSGLLGQVAGGGNIMGQVLAEGIARGAGLKTQEEAQAEKAQSIFKNLDQSSAESVMGASKELADLGLTKASFAMAQQGMKLQEEAAKKAREQAQQDSAVKWLNSKEMPELAQGVAGGFIPASVAVEQALKGRDTKVVGNSLVDTESGQAVYTEPTKPGDEYRMLTPAEVAEKGLPKSGTYQINIKDSKITAVKSSDRPTDLNAPAGFQYIYGTRDDGTQYVVRAEPIPGTPQYDEFQAQKARVQNGIRNTKDQVVNVVGPAVKGALKIIDDDSNWATGMKGATVALAGKLSGGVLVAGTSRKALQGELDTIKANVAFDRLQRMREDSKTGGALGNVSNVELGLLANNIAALDPDLDRAKLRENILKVEDSYKRAAEAVANDLTDDQLRQFGLEDMIPFRTATRNDDGTYTPLPEAEEGEGLADPHNIRGLLEG